MSLDSRKIPYEQPDPGALSLRTFRNSVVKCIECYLSTKVKERENILIGKYMKRRKKKKKIAE